MNVIIRQKQGYIARDRREFPCGSVADLDERLALKLIRYGIAAPAPEPEPEPKPKPVIETAAKTPAENTAKRTSKPAPRKGAK